MLAAAFGHAGTMLEGVFGSTYMLAAVSAKGAGSVTSGISSKVSQLAEPDKTHESINIKVRSLEKSSAMRLRGQAHEPITIKYFNIYVNIIFQHLCEYMIVFRYIYMSFGLMRYI